MLDRLFPPSPTNSSSKSAATTAGRPPRPPGAPRAAPADDAPASRSDDDTDLAVVAASLRASLAAPATVSAAAASSSTSSGEKTDGTEKDDDLTLGADDGAAARRRRRAVPGDLPAPPIWAPDSARLGLPSRRADGSDSVGVDAAPAGVSRQRALLLARAASAPGAGLAGRARATSLDPAVAARQARRAAGLTVAQHRRALAASGSRSDRGTRPWGDPLPTRSLAADPALKAELRVLHLRSAMDPRRFYRAMDSSKFPERFDVGRVIAGADDRFSGAMTRREQRASLVDEILGDAAVTAYRRRKVADLQAEAERFQGSSKKRARGRGGGRDLARDRAKPRRPRH